MPKYLVQASYTAEDLRAVAKDSAAGREAAIREALGNVGGKLEAIYFALGEDDVYVLCECPDNVAVAAVSLAASSSGLVRTKTTALLTVAEVDRAIAMKTGYRAPGAGKQATA